MRTTVVSLADKMRTEADAYRFMEQLRWGDAEPTCPHCGHQGATYIEPTNGVSRKTRTGAMSERRVWRCRSCRKQFSAITGTIFHGTKVPLRTWVLVVFEMVASKNGIAAREVERKYGVCARTAWHMMHRIREAMRADGLVDAMRGVVVADETFFGPSAKRRRNPSYHPTDGEPVRVQPGERQQWRNSHFKHTGRTVVMTLVERNTGRTYSRVIPDVTGATLRKVIAERVDLAATTLHTDEWSGYRVVARELAGHRTVKHSLDEYARREGGEVVTSNQAENFFSQLKRSLDGTHHHVSRHHLHRYLAEFDYRYTTRRMSDGQRMRALMGQVEGRRLTYKRVTT